MKGFPDLPPIWWMGSIAVIYLGKWVLPGLHFDGAILTGLSWLTLIGALIVIAWSAIWFFRKKTPIEPHHTPKTLIVEGPYRLSRNPIYLALVILTVSSALGHGSILGLIAAAALWKLLDQRFAAPEEALLRETFADEAEAYLAKTKRWI
ncbi:methyltransferase family protein [Sulfitobacter donghicola]|uniref:S-isoprenylcysteine methyltransferase n=1 Tax=Sulfitobacter donghicola DSW-25 = KCTC 12864 = JCM 14565 TaxID=1300350 RepID=A0A073IIX5_9RHOB|nr:isoprenylcysteine carboxylmethyltransferase family protein [Sulfitobacter donghicola]KEJ89714.1 S-isoprenylcysteine methyltransferase [Sulfitobacter donghicola DSW-25 = KCTC 12864 = JCM 14565]KIN67192.1 Isoprenylcysteine carboxyl methyltransferase family protein [Sulfitobacter donghicola DSW-25 = KCTC 12864 = JCM 14565]